MPEGYVVPSHGHGRIRPFRPGQIGNPTGQNGRYAQLVSFCRNKSMEMTEILYRIAGDENEDARCRIVACQEILGRAFGRIPAEVKVDGAPPLDLEAVSEQKLELVIRALEAARDAKRAQASEGESASRPVERED